ncbi:hypothetical protein A8709_26335 [Paenibacillus pectinilyticus]|uniref:Uncharacterized protein n=1 Tax=Paenibacillus pectinilyticus TaxID=512399 RepID=A0A1C1A1E0_9BACL|nr:DUF6042 family protein [Paenibacillus pectinilyticus]OCT14346.1 hypothetical protein A8709_26335 [Paenibacillus pectinilyticus]
MNLGKITVRLLSKLNLITANQCILPKGFYEYGWAEWLPLVNISTLPQISYCVSKEFTREDTVQYLSLHKSNQLFCNFENADILFGTEYQINEYYLIYSRELMIKENLKKNGFSYPNTMEEVIDLFLQLGFLIQQSDQSGNIILDMVIRPFPKVTDKIK